MTGSLYSIDDPARSNKLEHRPVVAAKISGETIVSATDSLDICLAGLKATLCGLEEASQGLEHMIKILPHDAARQRIEQQRALIQKDVASAHQLLTGYVPDEHAAKRLRLIQKG